MPAALKPAFASNTAASRHGGYGATLLAFPDVVEIVSTDGLPGFGSNALAIFLVGLGPFFAFL